MEQYLILIYWEIIISLYYKNKVNKLIFNDIYIIHYPNIGINNQEYLRVVTLPNTKNILTMYPINNKYDVIDDDYMEEIEHTKVKKLTIK